MELVHEEALQFHNIGQEVKCTKLVFLRNKTTKLDKWYDLRYNFDIVWFGYWSPVHVLSLQSLDIAPIMIQINKKI